MAVRARRGRRTQEDFPGTRADVPEPGQLVGQGAGQDDREVRPPFGDGRDDGSEFGQRAALVGARRIARPGQDRVDGGIEQEPAHRERDRGSRHFRT